MGVSLCRIRKRGAHQLYPSETSCCTAALASWMLAASSALLSPPSPPSCEQCAPPATFDIHQLGTYIWGFQSLASTPNIDFFRKMFRRAYAISTQRNPTYTALTEPGVTIRTATARYNSRCGLFIASIADTSGAHRRRGGCHLAA